MKFVCGFVLSIVLLSDIFVECQETFIDQRFLSNFRAFRRNYKELVGRTGESYEQYRRALQRGKVQKPFPNSTSFFCDINGPGKRSPRPPTSVHKLRPGDIDIIGGMGDSLMAGDGSMALSVTEVFIENRGVSWALGGQADWRKFLTVSNIIKEFNPNLYGYSVGDALSTERASRFNVGEGGAMSRDMPYSAKILLQRMKSDPKVDMKNHWKLINFLIGPNDFCGDLCYHPRLDLVLNQYEKDLVAVLRYLRDNVPRLMVNILAPPNLKLITEYTGLPDECLPTLLFSCPCLFGKNGRRLRPKLFKIMDEWIDRQRKIIYRDEFNTNEFTVNQQISTTGIVFPKTKKGYTNLRYLAPDCFHLSQIGYARIANAMWNNMMEPEGNKSRNWSKEFTVFKCPTENNPYIFTRVNSKSIIGYNKINNTK